ncbi:hypothetical protein CPB84DRAFT_1841556 [Gymnopilus junonius]|uniref:Uncharacterized protein n=1 Tax=Gymnopilus junonius TaxID=109634 RepID=A0A9P5TVD9_GYMJU|nr:hypothetical protein CPB84DRAFT_1841556 [Gymnopilus junonius]
MPLLSGLFSRKHKASAHSKRDEPTDSIYSTPSELDSPHSSPTTSSYVNPPHPNSRSFLHPDSARETSPRNVYSPAMSSTPSSSNGGKLRLFGRKKPALPGSDATNNPSPEVGSKNFSTSPRPTQPSRTSTDTESVEVRRMRPPPSRSAIFAAYADPSSALSTRSLPNDPSSLSSAAVDLSPASQHSQKRPSLFPWTKQSSSSPTSSRFNDSTSNLARDLPVTQTSPDASHSFNLKSFRHVRPPSPTRSNASNVSLTPPVVPRPRGASVNSDSSQRISVAAFREAQARRSLAGSPSPSFRSPSPAPAIPGEETARPRPARSSPSIPDATKQRRRRSSMALAYTSNSDSSQSESGESEDEFVQPKSGTRQSAFDRPGRVDKGRAKSELGHGLNAEAYNRMNDRTRPSHATKSHVGHSFSPSPSSRDVPTPRSDEDKKLPEMPPRSQSSLSHYAVGVRQRSSVSTSALTPSAAAKRASILASSNTNLNNYPRPRDEEKTALRGQSRRPSEPMPSIAKPPVKNSTDSQTSRKNTQASSDSDSDDNAPLASLVGPRRPGSAMSSYSNLNSRSTGNVATRSHTQPPKPLIDINELTCPKRTFTSPLLEKNMIGFTEGPTLLSQGRPLVESPISQTASPWPSTSDDDLPITRTDPPHKFLTPQGTPAKEMEQYFSNSDVQSMQKRSSLDAEPSPGPSPEPKRDRITDRLTKVIQQNLSPNGAATVQHTSATSKPSLSRPTSPTSDVSNNSRTRSIAPVVPKDPKVSDVVSQPVPVEKSPANVPVKTDHSPPDEELAKLLGPAVKFISLNGESSEESSESESDEDDEDDAKEDKDASKDRIAPIPIKRRSPPPSFSVTSRPPLHRREDANSFVDSPSAKDPSSDYTRPRSTTLTDATSTKAFPPRKPSFGNPISPSPGAKLSSATSSSGSSNATSSNQSSRAKPEAFPNSVRQRSTTMLTGVPLSAQMSKPSHAPGKPFAVRRDSPASSTGDSSSGRAPLTPKDDSDFGAPDDKRKGHVKRRSVSFEDDMEDLKPPSRNHFKESARSGSEAGNTSNEEDREQKRRQRRRGEAKAAIELGKVINGRGPVVEDHDDLPVNQVMNMNPRMSTLSLNPMMGMANPMTMQMGYGVSPNPAGWGANMGQPMLSPAQFMIPPPADPNFLAAHQQAMMIAKQAYQYAVAQQAMAAAGDEWERGSAIGGYSGSVYGGSTSGTSMMNPYGMMGMMPGNSWPSSASVYGGGARSMYGASLSPQDAMISSSRSEFGGPSGRGGGGNWSSSRSSYGDSFRPSLDPYGRKGAKRPGGTQSRESGYFPPVPPIPASQMANGRSSPDQRGNPRMRTTSQPASPARATRKAPPPSSWKAGV